MPIKNNPEPSREIAALRKKVDEMLAGVFKKEEVKAGAGQTSRPDVILRAHKLAREAAEAWAQKEAKRHG